MWAVSDEFLAALAAGLQHESTATVTIDDVETALEISACTIQVGEGLQHRKVSRAEFGSATSMFS